MNIIKIINEYAMTAQDYTLGVNVFFFFKRYIFSIGVFKEERSRLVLDQIFAPLVRPIPLDDISETLIFAIDPLFNGYPFPDELKYTMGKTEIVLEKNTNDNGSIYFYNSAFKIQLIFIGERLDSQYGEQQKWVFKSFNKTFQCVPGKTMNGHPNYWIDLYYYIQYLLYCERKVYINNYAYVESTLWVYPKNKQPYCKKLTENRYFEFFPELGFILNMLAISDPNAQSIFISNREYGRTKIVAFVKHNPKLEEWLAANPKISNPFIDEGPVQQTTGQNQFQLAILKLRQLGIEFPKAQQEQGYIWQARAP